MKYPLPLRRGDKIGITAPSSGVPPEKHPRLDLVLNHLRSQGFDVVEGECLRAQHKHVSGPRQNRADELIRFWNDPEIKAVMPPWGGEVLVEILPLLDFEKLKNSEPKWISGYSDISTLAFALTSRSHIATLHGSNLMELSPSQNDPLTSGLMPAMQLRQGGTFSQNSSEKFMAKWTDFETDVAAPMAFTEDTKWKTLGSDRESVKFSGRIIGGCLDTIARLAGTPYADLPGFTRNFRGEGVIFYFENCEMVPCELARTLWNLRLAGWFSGLSGMLIGRSSGPEAKSPNDLSYVEVLSAVLSDLDIPVVYDVDIGHKPPNLNIINGSLAAVEYENGRGKLTQHLL